jgi:peptidoglycan/LPS O-acetylase OafA/YrhL
MQLGYVILMALALQRHIAWIAVAIVGGTIGLSFVVWRIFERPVHSAVKSFLSEVADRLGWPSRARSIAA